MIVANKAATQARASEISNLLIKRLFDEAEDFECPDDPAEHIYLATHIVANLTAKMCLSLQEYGKVYGIPNLEADTVQTWVKVITREYITTLNSDVINKNLNQA